MTTITKRYYVHMIIVNPYTDSDLNRVQASTLPEAEDVFEDAVNVARDLSGGSEIYFDGMDIVVRLIDTEPTPHKVVKACFISETEGTEISMDGKDCKAE